MEKQLAELVSAHVRLTFDELLIAAKENHCVQELRGNALVNPIIVDVDINCGDKKKSDYENNYLALLKIHLQSLAQTKRTCVSLECSIALNLKKLRKVQYVFVQMHLNDQSRELFFSSSNKNDFLLGFSDN